jgi:hypothetical protein
MAIYISKDELANMEEFTIKQEQMQMKFKKHI